MHKPVYDAGFNVWFVTRFSADGECQGSVAHAPNKELAQRWCDALNADAKGYEA
jgi:hypothetical protein